MTSVRNDNEPMKISSEYPRPQKLQNPQIQLNSVSQVLRRQFKNSNIKREADEAIQSKYVPAGVVINAYMEVVQFRGDTSPYLMHPPGALTADFFKMCRNGFLADLRAAFQATNVNNIPIKKASWVDSSAQKRLPIWIDVIPFISKGTHNRHLVVLFSPRLLNSEVSVDVSSKMNAEIFRLQNELISTAQEVNQVKLEFVANMSHEMRTPLTAIMGYAELVAAPNQTKSESIQCAGRITKSGEQLTKLINEILDISELDAGKLEVNRVKFKLLPELTETFAMLQNIAKDKGLRFQTTFRGAIPETITTCPIRLRQLLNNIVGNAIKFTHQGGVDVTVEMGKAPLKRLCIIVADTGCGLNPQQKNSLFQIFSQGDSSLTRQYGGIGLGLTHAQRLAQVLGGNVMLTSSVINKGSVFTIEIEPEPLKTAHHQVASSESPNLDSNVAVQDLQGMRLLLVEDCPDNQTIITAFLKASGAIVELARNGPEALEMAQSNYYNLVFMDIQIPGLNGYEVTQRLISNGYESPIVALTAHAMKGEGERCLAAGCVGYLSKPISASVLTEAAVKFAKKQILRSAEELGKSELADDPVVGPIVVQFVQQLPNRLAALCGAQESSDWKQISTLAHQLAGAAGGYGFPELGKLAAKIEQHANDCPSLGTMTKLFEEFDFRCNRMIKASLQLH